MKFNSLLNKAIIAAIAIIVVAIVGCKKQDLSTTKEEPVFTKLPDSTLFISTIDQNNNSNLGITIYALNATTGALAVKYNYPVQPNTTWCFPSVGNGFLYSLENKKINAIDMNTGTVLWTDTVNNYSVPVLHDKVFYGLYIVSRNVGANSPYEEVTYGVYALDATKASKTYLWKYEANDQSSVSAAFPFDINSLPITPLVRYYNGTIYVSIDARHITALDAQTGKLKWKISTNAYGYSMNALNNGIIMAGNTAIDAISGIQIATINPTAVSPVYGLNTTITATLEYATPTLYLIKTSHYNTPPGLSTSFLSAVDRTGGTEKWRVAYGSGQVNYDTIYRVSQLWNNQLVVQKTINTGAGKYGVYRTDDYNLLKNSNGALGLTFSGANKGITTESFIVNNTMYFNKTGYSLGAFTTPPVNFLFAIDMTTGKPKWNNDQLLTNYTGYAYSCVYAGGTGFSPFIQ